MELKKVQKQGRDERMQEDYPTSAKYIRYTNHKYYMYCIYLLYTIS